MKLKLTYSSADEIPANFKDLYEEQNGTFRFVAIEGLKTQEDINKITTGLEKERKEHKETKAKLGSILGDRTPEDVLALLDRIPELEASAGKIDDDKVNAIVESRVKVKVAPLERELTQLKTKVTESDQLIQTYQSKDKQRAIHDSVRQVASKMKVLDTAQEDVLMLAERMFEVNEDGTVTAKDGVGVTPGVTPDVWLSEMQQKRPHWWPPTVGGGGKGSGAGGGLANNPFSAEHWNLTEQGNLVRNMGMEKATQIASSVGVDINRPVKPAIKK
jgi:hypothetical protein